MMKKKGLPILIVLLLVLIAAYAGYSILSKRVAPENPHDGDAAETTDGPSEGASSGEGSEAADTAPDFTVLDRDGNAVKLSDYFGKPIVVNFWATWCGPCRQELPHFNAACETYGGEIAFLMVDLTDGERDTIEAVNSFVSENGYTFPVYFDTEFDAVYAYNAFSIPLTVFIDAEGRIVSQQIGSMNEETLMSQIEKIKP